MADSTDPEPLDGEDLLRCVPPGFVDNGYSMDEPSARVFWPHKNDDWQLSVDRELIRSPEEAHKFRIDVMQKPSVGILSVSTADVAEVSLLAYADAIDGNDAHARIDYRPRQGDKAIRETLLARALRRGWRFLPD